MSRRLVLTLITAALATALSLLLDPWVWRHVSYPSVYDHDWGRMLRVTGSLVLWAPLSLAVWLEARARGSEAPRRGWLLFLGPLLAGAGGELLKLLVRRERPDLHAGAYFYRSFSERPLDSHDLGFPSSHVVVAFAGAAVLARLFPRAGAVAYSLALGCAVTRVLAQAHFASDVVAGGILGWAVGAWLGRTMRHTGTQSQV
ncbi:MAG TPA: phosphatase PAP2 family protein [Gemmatimonadales bacterium]|jgi:membrane-associated phospholipid phosphatase|nr:phosphatase PAP2 family protein [Gemmatimonadales bacterium]